jgi:hypothetical protein
MCKHRGMNFYVIVNARLLYFYTTRDGINRSSTVLLYSLLK